MTRCFGKIQSNVRLLLALKKYSGILRIPPTFTNICLAGKGAVEMFSVICRGKETVLDNRR